MDTRTTITNKTQLSELEALTCSVFSTLKPTSISETMAQISSEQSKLNEILNQYNLTSSQKASIILKMREMLLELTPSLSSTFSKVSSFFTSFLSKLESETNLQGYFGVSLRFSSTDVESNNYGKILEQLRFLESIAIAEFKSFLNQNMELDTFPNLIFKPFFRKLKNYVRMRLKKECKVTYIKVKAELSEIFQCLKPHFRAFIDGKIMIFDSSIYSQGDLEHFFQMFCFSTDKSIENNLISDLETLLKFDFDQTSTLMKKYKKPVLLDFLAKSSLKTIWMIICDFSILLNGFISIKGGEKATFVSELSSSARNHQALKQFVAFIDENRPDSEPKKVLRLLETTIYNDLIESYCFNLFDENRIHRLPIKPEEEDILSVKVHNRVIEVENEFRRNSLEGKLKSTFNYLSSFVSKTKEKSPFDLVFKPMTGESVHKTIILFVGDNWGPCETQSDCYKVEYKLNLDKLEKVKGAVVGLIKDEADVKKSKMNHIFSQTAFVGQYLGCLLVARNIFKFQSVSFVGSGIGCHLIKHCLKEIANLGKNDLVKDVVFCCGETFISASDQTDFTNLPGKKTNLYTKQNQGALTDIFVLMNELPIGASRIQLKGFENRIIEGFGKKEYEQQIDFVLKKINL